jgi:hypothetical protein
MKVFVAGGSGAMNIRRVPQLRGCPLWRRPSGQCRRASKFLDTVHDGEVSDLIEVQAADVVSTATAAGRAVDVPGDLQHGEPQPPAAAVLRDLSRAASVTGGFAVDVGRRT